VPEVRRSLQDALDGGVRAVVLDLADVPFIDSGALGMMVWLHKQLRQRGGRVCVVAAQPSVRDLFERTSVHRLIAIYDRVELAEADLATSSES
jgi:anti-sigma B factor antagonist